MILIVQPRLGRGFALIKFTKATAQPWLNRYE